MKRILFISIVSVHTFASFTTFAKTMNEANHKEWKPNQKQAQIMEELKELTQDINGIQILFSAEKVLIDGQVLTIREMNRIQSIQKMYGNQVHSLVKINPRSPVILANVIQKEINNPDIKVRAINGKIILEGLASKEEASRARSIATQVAQDQVVSEALQNVPVSFVPLPK